MKSIRFFHTNSYGQGKQSQFLSKHFGLFGALPWNLSSDHIGSNGPQYESLSGKDSGLKS